MPGLYHYNEDDKGETIIVIKGKYDGREGWRHKSYLQPKKMIYVILKAMSDQPEVCCRIHRSSIREVNFENEPQTLTAALLKDHKDVAIDMQRLVEKLAEVHNYNPNTEFLEVFWKMWQDEKGRHGRLPVQRVRVVTSLPSAAAAATATSPTTASAIRAQTTATTNPTNRVSIPHVIPDGWDS